MPDNRIGSLFARDIGRHIEEVIKVSRTDDDVVRDEVEEYVVTPAIREHMIRLLDTYLESANRPELAGAVWLSGFFGSGKSSLAKLLALAIANRQIGNTSVAERLAARAEDEKVTQLLRLINERIAAHAVIFDIGTERNVASSTEMPSLIMYRLLLRSLGYVSRDLRLAELEITLEQENMLDRFKEEYARQFDGEWDAKKDLVAFSLNEASAVLNTIAPQRFATPDSWLAGAVIPDVSPRLFTQRAIELTRRRKPGHNLLFVVDELGQFVARDVQKMLDVQGVVEQFAALGGGKLWFMGTAQERLNELVGSLGDRTEISRLIDRFPERLRIHLQQADISYVTSRRVLAKKADAQTALRSRFQETRGSLVRWTQLTATIKLPDIDADGFISLYPLLPYHIDLIVQIVSGLRSHGAGITQHVGGANRTIIKLAQQLLVNPKVLLAEQPVGRLVTIGHIYDLIENNLPSDVVQKIASIPQQVPHPLTHDVAKAVCLLKYAESIPASAGNIAALLHPAAESESMLSQVNEALTLLEGAQKIRRGKDGYRIPTPAEDSWESDRSGMRAAPGDIARTIRRTLKELWDPQPSHELEQTKLFRASLWVDGNEDVPGDLPIHVRLFDDVTKLRASSGDLRQRSQNERKAIFWGVARTSEIDHHAEELFRSTTMLELRGRQGDARLVSEENQRALDTAKSLRALLSQALLGGVVYFDGGERSVAGSEVPKAAEHLLAAALPQVFERFAEGAAQIREKDLASLLTSPDLRGLTKEVEKLRLTRNDGGKVLIVTESGPLVDVMGLIERRFRDGQTTFGKTLVEEFARDPYGWSFDVVRLFATALLRAGKIAITCGNQTFESSESSEAREAFSNNTKFRSSALRPRKTLDGEQLVEADKAFHAVFGRETQVLETGAIARQIRAELAPQEGRLERLRLRMTAHSLPGTAVLGDALEQMRNVLAGDDAGVILGFNASHGSMRDAFARASQLEQALTDGRLEQIRAARETMARTWLALQHESDLDSNFALAAAELRDVLQRETFYLDFAAMNAAAKLLEDEWTRRRDAELASRCAAYRDALNRLAATREWGDLTTEQRAVIASPLELRSTPDEAAETLSELRLERENADRELSRALANANRLIDDARLATVPLRDYFSGRIETREELATALARLEEHCASLLAEGKRILIQ